MLQVVAEASKPFLGGFQRLSKGFERELKGGLKGLKRAQGREELAGRAERGFKT